MEADFTSLNAQKGLQIPPTQTHKRGRVIDIKTSKGAERPLSLLSLNARKGVRNGNADSREKAVLQHTGKGPLALLHALEAFVRWIGIRDALD